MVNAQEYINQKYPTKEEREKEIKLDVSKQNLEGELDLSDFVNLTELNCSNNLLTGLNLKKNKKLNNLDCSGNKSRGSIEESGMTQLDLSENTELICLDCSKNLILSLDLSKNTSLTYFYCIECNILLDLDLSRNSELTKLYCGPCSILSNIKFLKQLANPEKLKVLFLIQGNFPPLALDIFSRFVNLEELYITNNRFYGSLKPLGSLTKLRRLEISRTNVDDGLEYLPESLEDLECLSHEEEDYKSIKITRILGDYQADIQL
jgi:hypothetical protein